MYHAKSKKNPSQQERNASDHLVGASRLVLGKKEGGREGDICTLYVHSRENYLRLFGSLCFSGEGVGNWLYTI